MKKSEERSVDPASVQMLDVVAKAGVSVAWDRYDAMQPQCGFGSLGVCCRHCNMGPCRIDPFGDGPSLLRERAGLPRLAQLCPGAPVGLQSLLEQCLSESPEQRPSSASQAKIASTSGRPAERVK